MQQTTIWEPFENAKMQPCNNAHKYDLKSKLTCLKVILTHWWTISYVQYSYLSEKFSTFKTEKFIWNVESDAQKLHLLQKCTTPVRNFAKFHLLENIFKNCLKSCNSSNWKKLWMTIFSSLNNLNFELKLRLMIATTLKDGEVQKKCVQYCHSFL